MRDRDTVKELKSLGLEVHEMSAGKWLFKDYWYEVRKGREVIALDEDMYRAMLLAVLDLLSEKGEKK